MICNKCGRENPRDAKFCAYCGNNGDAFTAPGSRYGARRTYRASRIGEPDLPRAFAEPSIPKEPTLPGESDRSETLHQAQKYKANLLAKSKEKMARSSARQTKTPFGTTATSSAFATPAVPGSKSVATNTAIRQSPTRMRPKKGSAALGTGLHDERNVSWRSDSAAPQTYKSPKFSSGKATPLQEKKTSAVGCIVWPIVLSILLGVLSQLGNISNTVSDLLFNSEAEQQSTNKYYDDAIPEVTDPVVLIDDDLVKISFDGNGGILQGSTKYPSYCVPILVENKSDRHFDVLLYEESADNLPEDAASIIWIYTNLTTGEHYVLDFQANCETLAWLEIYDPPTDERIINFKGVLNIVDAEDHTTLAEYEIDIPEL